MTEGLKEIEEDSASKHIVTDPPSVVSPRKIILANGLRMCSRMTLASGRAP